MSGFSPGTRALGEGPPGRPLPEAAYAAALASLPGVGPGWLARILSGREPSAAWRAVLEGTACPPRRECGPRRGPGMAGLQAAAAGFDLGGLWARCRDRGVQVAWVGEPAYPDVLADGPSPPGVLFWAGSLVGLGGKPAVAVIGTRRCTPAGAEVAWKLGYDLAGAGVVVVSGLALGIDGAAHAGALSAARDVAGAGGEAGAPHSHVTFGVAASGPDVVYPRQHASLWREVQRHGAVLSEAPPGTPAQSWRFPSRNRVIAGLAQMVVVVESHAGGGSWHTVEAALRRGVEVGAVPGPVTSSASCGTNTLLHEGALPVRGAQDVLDALGLLGLPELAAPQRRGGRSGAEARPQEPGQRWPAPVAAKPARAALGAGRGHGAPPPATALKVSPASEPGPVERRLLAALGWQPLCLDELVERSGLPPGAVVVGLERLEQEGVVTSAEGWWSRGSQLTP